MKVLDLITILNRCDGDSEVYVNFNTDNPIEEEQYPIQRVYAVTYPSIGETTTYINASD